MPNMLSGHFRTGSHALSGLSHQISAYQLPQSCNLGGMSMNIQRKNSSHHFLVQSDRGGHLGANEPTVALKCFFFGSEEAP